MLLANFWVPSWEELVPFAPELTLIGVMLALLTLPIIFGRSVKMAVAITLLGVAVAFFFTVRVGRQVLDGGISGLAGDLTGGMLIVDNLSIFYKLILLVFLAAVVSLWWMGPRLSDLEVTEFFTLLIGSAFGMALMVSTTNLLMVVVAIEMASLPSYALVGFDKRDRLGAEASLKYVVFGGVCAAIMLFGGSILYGLYGTLDLRGIAEGLYGSLTRGTDIAVAGMASLCMLGGIAFKISAVPFHFWCPDAFQGARIEVTTWLSVVSKAAGLLLLLRIIHAFTQVSTTDPLPVLYPLAWGIGILAAVTCTVGNFAAYRQTSVKRLLAYSSIAHAGYMMMAAAVFAAPGKSGGCSSTAMSAVLLYVLIYMFMNLGAFGVVAMVVWQTGSDSINSFTGLMRRAPWLAVPMLCCLISLVGLPPFAGFIGKYWLLMALMERGLGAFWLYPMLAIVAVLNTLFSLYYYMRIVIQMMLKDDGQPELSPPPLGVAMVNVCAVILVAILIFAGPIKAGTDRYASHLFNGGQPSGQLQTASSE